tara:strand:- start:1101 stop:1478 length:378 start_codon:yes stop_codon:yes gene_type:complete
MLYFIFFSGLALTMWTAAVVRAEGAYQEEVKEELILTLSNSKVLLGNIKTLVTLLFKDLVKAEKFKRENNSISNSKKITYLNVNEEKEIQSPSSKENEEEFYDSSLVDFSPEVINLIEEEEEKIA